MNLQFPPVYLTVKQCDVYLKAELNVWSSHLLSSPDTKPNLKMLKNVPVC